MDAISTNPPGETCETCRFWRRDPSGDQGTGWGQCRRMPPAMPPIEVEKLVHVGVWPHTQGGEWCGEWETGGADLRPPVAGWTRS